MAQLVLDNISKTYRPRGKEPVQAVKRVSLEVKDGEIVALLGSSGCGKTSMLRMIAGFEEVTEGAIRIGGKEIHTLPPAQRDVAMAFEGYSLYPPLTVRDNIGFALKASRLSAVYAFNKEAGKSTLCRRRSATWRWRSRATPSIRR